MGNGDGNGTKFLASGLFWKIAILSFTAGGMLYQFNEMNSDLDVVQKELRSQANLNARVHVYLMQRLSSVSPDAGPAVLRPLSAQELELLGLLKKEAGE